jgi:hypothetical protein
MRADPEAALVEIVQPMKNNIKTSGYGFLFEITKTCRKSQDFWFGIFFLRFLKSKGWFGFPLWIFGCFKSVSSVSFLLCTNIHSTKCCPPPPSPCTVVLLSCDIMLVIDLPDSVGNLWPFSLLPSRVQKKNTNKKTKIRPKIYVFQCMCIVHL